MDLASTPAGEGVGSDALQRNRPAISEACEKRGGRLLWRSPRPGSSALSDRKSSAARRHFRKLALLEALGPFSLPDPGKRSPWEREVGRSAALSALSGLGKVIRRQQATQPQRHSIKAGQSQQLLVISDASTRMVVSKTETVLPEQSWPERCSRPWGALRLWPIALILL